MQGKLIIAKTDKKKLESAAHFSNTKLGDAITVGSETHVEAKAPSAADFFNLGVRFTQMDGTELDAVKAAQKAKEEAAKAKAKEAGKK